MARCATRLGWKCRLARRTGSSTGSRVGGARAWPLSRGCASTGSHVAALPWSSWRRRHALRVGCCGEAVLLARHRSELLAVRGSLPLHCGQAATHLAQLGGQLFASRHLPRPRPRHRGDGTSAATPCNECPGQAPGTPRRRPLAGHHGEAVRANGPQGLPRSAKAPPLALRLGSCTTSFLTCLCGRALRHHRRLPARLGL
mmetsp:Transcript_2901/g.8598  ORF Transcript_2901/g.8598 Transcript_2901/m.8598 type:complete len:200 (-) Transcript_2901:526-1125(-)